MGLAAADKDRGAAITVTSGAAALLATEFLAGAGDLGTLASAARLAAPIGKLPIDDADPDNGAWLQAEDFVVELDIAGGGCVECLTFLFHFAHPSSFCSAASRVGNACFRTCRFRWWRYQCKQ